MCEPLLPMYDISVSENKNKRYFHSRQEQK